MYVHFYHILFYDYSWFVLTDNIFLLIDLGLHKIKEVCNPEMSPKTKLIKPILNNPED